MSVEKVVESARIESGSQSWEKKSKYEQLVFPLAIPQVKMAARAFLGAAHQKIVQGSQELLLILLCPEEHVIKSFYLM